MSPKIGMVGTPCQIIAATIMKDYESFIKEFPVTLKGSRKHMKNLDDKDVMVAIPYSQVERIIQNLEEMKDKPIFVG